jgi:hypothetical protein
MNHTLQTTPAGPEIGSRPVKTTRAMSGRAHRLRRKAIGLLLALTAVSGVDVAAAGPAAADNGFTIQNGELAWTYLGQYWYWYEPYGQWYLADAYAPPYGGGRLYCWAGTVSCWFEAFPPFGNAADAWTY